MGSTSAPAPVSSLSLHVLVGFSLALLAILTILIAVVVIKKMCGSSIRGLSLVTLENPINSRKTERITNQLDSYSLHL